MHTSSGPRVEIHQLGRVPFTEALALQNELRERHLAGSGTDTVLLLEHPHTITFGRGSRPENSPLSDTELRRAGYEVFRIRRGGDVTYHGPGQIVGYPILDLALRGRDLSRYLRALESVLIETLSLFAIPARRRAGFTGVWIDESRKIASIGIGVRRWVTAHGFALNVSTDLARFDAVVPCGLSGVRMTNMCEFDRSLEVCEVLPRLEAALLKEFG